MVGGGFAANFGIQLSVSSQLLKPGSGISGSVSGSYLFLGVDAGARNVWYKYKIPVRKYNAD